MVKKNGPWVIKETKRIYEDEFIKVDEDEVVRPDGEPGTYSTVRVKPGVIRLAIDNENYVYLTKQFRYALGQDSIEVVCRAVEENESALEAAKREVREEVGIEGSEWADMGTVDLETSIVNCRTSLFIVRDLRHVETDRDPTESMKTLKMSLDKAVAMVMNSEITHGPSCVLSLKAYHLKIKRKRNEGQEAEKSFEH
jgi:hypothetical protein